MCFLLVFFSFCQAPQFSLLVSRSGWIDNTVLWAIEEIFAVCFRFECRIVVNGGTIEVLLNLMYRLQVDYMNSY